MWRLRPADGNLWRVFTGEDGVCFSPPVSSTPSAVDCFYIFIYIGYSVFCCSSSLCEVSVFLFPLQDRLMPTVSAAFRRSKDLQTLFVFFYMFMLILKEIFFYCITCRAHFCAVHKNITIKKFNKYQNKAYWQEMILKYWWARAKILSVLINTNIFLISIF